MAGEGSLSTPSGTLQNKQWVSKGIRQECCWFIHNTPISPMLPALQEGVLIMLTSQKAPKIILGENKPTALGQFPTSWSPNYS